MTKISTMMDLYAMICHNRRFASMANANNQSNNVLYYIFFINIFVFKDGTKLHIILQINLNLTI